MANSNKKSMGNPSTELYAGKGLSAGSQNKVNIGAPPKGTSHNQVMCSVYEGTPPSKSGQTSGMIKHERSGNKIENMIDAPKTNTM